MTILVLSVTLINTEMNQLMKRKDLFWLIVLEASVMIDRLHYSGAVV
jgi:hypothetical protein